MTSENELPFICLEDICIPFSETVHIICLFLLDFWSSLTSKSSLHIKEIILLSTMSWKSFSDLIY